MKKEDIPFYSDPADFENGGNTYPCNTQFMVYNPLLHEYFLTEEALNYYGVDAERRYVSDSPNKTRELIEKATKKIYDTIRYMSGWQNFEVQLYRIAISHTKACKDEYYFRKQFEMALVEQARYIINSGDPLKYSQANMEAGQQKPLLPEEMVRNLDDISPEALRTLESLGLTRWFTLWQFHFIDGNKY